MVLAGPEDHRNSDQRLVQHKCNLSIVDDCINIHKCRCQRSRYHGHLVSTGVRADSVAVDWLGRNLYWIDGVNSQIVAVRLAPATVKSLDHSVILDEDLDQPRSLALLPQKGSASFHSPNYSTIFIKTNCTSIQSL